MVRTATITCPECEEAFDFDFDSEEFREYGGAECPECGHEIDDLDPSDYFRASDSYRGEPVPKVDLTRHKCIACEEIFGIRPEFGGEVNCPYCGEKYA